MIKQRTSCEIDAVNKSLLLLRLFAAFVEGRLEKAYDEAFSNYHNRNYDGIATNYYNGSILMSMVTGTGTTAIHQLFSYDSSGNVVSVDYSSNGGNTFTTYYYVRNAQNDVVKLISGSGTTVVEYTYDTWGKLLTTTGSLASTLGANQPFRYRGYVYDTETGWYYLQSRYYDPSIGRFISADVFLSTGQGVLGHNAFAYCNNRAVNCIDPDGMRPINAWNYAFTDGGQFNNCYSKREYPEFEEENEQFAYDTLFEAGVLTSADHATITSITSRYKPYEYTRRKKLLKETPRILASGIVGLRLTFLTGGLSLGASAAVGLGFSSAEAVVTTLTSDNDLDFGTYHGYEITINGYAYDSLTGQWSFYTQTYHCAIAYTKNDATRYIVLCSDSYVIYGG